MVARAARRQGGAGPHEAGLREQPAALAADGRREGRQAEHGLGRGLAGGPVLAPWPTEEVLPTIADRIADRTTAMCLLEWGEDEYFRAWVRAQGGTDVVTGDPAPGADELLPPVVTVAMEFLSQTVNHANVLVQRYDKGDHHPGARSRWTHLRCRQPRRLGARPRLHRQRGQAAPGLRDQDAPGSPFPARRSRDAARRHRSAVGAGGRGTVAPPGHDEAPRPESKGTRRGARQLRSRRPC